MTIRKGTNIIIGQVPTDTSITSTGIYPVTGAAIYTALGLKANDSGVVHLAGTETITGEKTFAGGQVTKFKDNTNAIGTYAANAWSTSTLYFSDSTGTRIARLQPAYITGTNILQMGMYASNGTTTEQGITVRNDGITSAPAPSASNSTSETKIATTGWVNDATKSTNVVHRDTNETITGIKTFNNSNNTTYSDAFIIQNNLLSNNYTAPSNNTDRYIAGKASNGDYCNWITFSNTTDGTKRTSMSVRRRDSSSDSNHDGSISVSIDSSNNVRCDLPANTYGTYFHGTADYAKWADLAECYQSDKKYPVGTLIRFGGEKDVTIANINCNGVISDKPGYLLDSELEDSQPVALVGKTPIRVIGKVKKFDKIVLSEIPGVGRVLQENEDKRVIARALENNDTFEEKLVMCVTKFNLD